MKTIILFLLLPLTLTAQETPKLPDSAAGLAELRRSYTSEFAILQKDFKNAKDKTSLDDVKAKLLKFTEKVNLLRGEHYNYFAGRSYDYSYSNYRPYGILGVLIVKHRFYRDSIPRSALRLRLKTTLHELKEMPLPSSVNIGPPEINQIQRALDKMYEALNLDSQIK